MNIYSKNRNMKCTIFFYKVKTSGFANVALFAAFALGISCLLGGCLKENLNPASGTPNDFIAVADVRKIFKDTDVILTKENMAGATQITGLVVSDAASGNFPTGTIALQQTSRTITRGIEIFFGGSDMPYKFGDSITISLEGASLGRRNGALQISTGISSSKKIAENVVINPVQVNLETLKSKFENYESVLIKLAHVSAVGGAMTLMGDVSLLDLKGNTGILHTESNANFANLEVPVNASYVGIARLNNSSANGTDATAKQVWPVNQASISDKSGGIYQNFPEDFENPDNALVAAGGYTTKTGSFKTGSYTLTNVAIGTDANDYPSSGVTALRLNQNSTTSSWTTMNYDLANGASKVTIWAGSYGASADLGSTWRLEYSQNQGITWSQIANDILTFSKTKEQFTFLMDIKGRVRFRIGKIGIGTSSVNNQNGRFSMDDFAVYENTGIGGSVNNPVPIAQTILGWQFGIPASFGNEATSLSTLTNAKLNTGLLTRGNGLIATTLARGYSSAAAGTVIPATKLLALAQNTFYQVAITVKAGSRLSITSINSRLRRSSAGAKSYRWYYSLDGVTFKETMGTGDVNYEGTETEGQEMPTYYVYGTPELQNIAPGQTVTLRMYCWGFANLNSGNFTIGRTPVNTTTNSLSIEGKVE